MSTFKGVVQEFPEIRIDFFRQNVNHRPPLACFLSHIHSDHLAGLESLKAPFVYCSPATREILLRLEKYRHRMDFAKGILERRKLTYKHLERLLKPIPLETPTKIELEPGNYITVTLFDANHCPGAVMFLIENETKAILYTGDIRSEPSMITNLRRSPYLIEYTTGLKTLDCIYLDTSNGDADLRFPPQAEGLAELIEKVKKYPKDTIFHFAAWTYGYEKVWMGLSKALDSDIHVDNYKLRIFKSLVRHSNEKDSPQTTSLSNEGPVLAGFYCGNLKQNGCLTANPDVRIHSCEKGTKCAVINGNPNIVWITPIVARLPDGTEIAEIGVGGGGGDLKQHAELELTSEADVDTFLEMMDFSIKHSEAAQLRQKLINAVRSSRMTISLDDLGLFELEHNQDEMLLRNLADLITQSMAKQGSGSQTSSGSSVSTNLPKRITFPYSRHSSFEELVAFVEAFKPMDVYPCTVDEDNWHEGIGMRIAFGKHCKGDFFRHDFEMRQQIKWQKQMDGTQQTHTTESEESDVSERETSPAPITSEFRKPPLPSIAKGPAFDRSGSSTNTSNPLTSQEASIPSEIVAQSPSSQSQNLRRKLIMAELEESGTTKRARLSDVGGEVIVSTEHEVKISVTSESASINLESSKSRVLPASEVYESIEGLPNSSPTVPTPPSSSDHPAEAGDYSNAGNVQELPHGPWFGRCENCNTEQWSEDYCLECCIQPPYFEAREEDGNIYDIVEDEYTEEFVDSEERHEILGSEAFLDVDSEAYDTQDEESQLNEEYEINSMIDDASENESDVDSDDDNDSGSEDDISFWVRKNEKLQERLAAIQAKHQKERQAHHFTKIERDTAQERLFDLMDAYGIDDDDDHEDDDMDEEGVLLVNPLPQNNPAVMEVILAHAQGDSQNSEVANEKKKDSVDVGVEGSQGMRTVPVVSTTGFDYNEDEIEF